MAVSSDLGGVLTVETESRVSISHWQWFSQQLLHWWLPTVETVSRAICRMRSTQFRQSLSAPVAVVVAVGNA